MQHSNEAIDAFLRNQKSAEEYEREVNYYFSQIDPQRILEREQRFERLDVSKLVPNEFYKELMYVVSLRSHPDEASRDMLLTDTRKIPTGTHFWRGRKLDADDHYLPLRGMNKLSDVWEPPTKYVRSAGRLNKPGEPLLYTAYETPLSVPDEIRVEDGEWFTLIKYESTSELSLTGIGLPAPVGHLSGRAAVGAVAVSEFFGRQFTRKASLNSGETYLISELVAKNNFDLPPAFHQGWIYPSVERTGALNATFRPGDARANLSFSGVAICRAYREEGRIGIYGHLFSPGAFDGNDFAWHSNGSDFQEAAFPEFTLN